MGANLITKAEYKAYASITSTNEDSVIDSLIPIVSQFVKTYCRTSFVDNIDDAVTEVFDGGFNTLSLKYYPVTKITDVAYSLDYGLTYTSLEEYIDYATNLKEGYVKAIPITGFINRINGYKVTYTYGYEDGIPADLKIAVMDLVTFYRKNSTAVHSPKAPGSNVVQIDYITNLGLPGAIARILDLYKLNIS